MDLSLQPDCDLGTDPGSATSMMSRNSSIAVSGSDRLINRLKNTNLEKFQTLVKMHLSFQLDLPGNGLEELLQEETGRCTGTAALRTAPKHSWHHSYFSKKKTNKDKENKVVESGIFGIPLSHLVIEQIHPLLEWLAKPENLEQEGLFRKNGQLGRQRVLEEKLNDGEDLHSELDSGIYTTHDVATLFKSWLGKLPEPLLTEKHYMAHCQVPEMASEEKQLQTVQLLLQLLPRDNALLLELVLHLLHQVAQEGQKNKMTSETLAMLFAPHILVPRKMTASELQANAPNVTRVLSFMIEKAPEVFQVPDPLVRDIANYWEEVEEASESRPGSAARSEDESDSACKFKFRKRFDPSDVAINTTVTFTDRQASQQAAANTDTQMALAQLYATVSNMPESSSKRKLLKKFNKANGLGTPMAGHSTASEKHKRSKSLGESIKRIVGRHHKRRGSGHSIRVHAVAQGPDPLDAYDQQQTTPQHTPVIKQRHIRVATPTPATPVMQLFKHHLQHSVLPSSPQVHIVDLKPTKCKAGKRKEPGTNSPLLISTPSSGSFCSITSSTSGHIDPENSENRNHEHEPLWIKKMKRRQDSPIVLTPKFEKPTAFISPITRSVNKASKAVQNTSL